MCKCPTGYECGECIKTPHKHAELIKAWADGAKIQYRDESWGWMPVNNPTWVPDMFYRIQPELKPDVVRYARASFTHYDPSRPSDNALTTETYWTCHKSGSDNIKASFDGETGKLKAVELI
jgi:hypothetical protein